MGAFFMQLKQKTVNYLNSTANKAESLLEKAMEYRSKYEKAESNISKEFYKKKLVKTVKKLEPLMALFKDLETIRNAKEVTETAQSEESAEEIKE